MQLQGPSAAAIPQPDACQRYPTRQQPGGRSSCLKAIGLSFSGSKSAHELEDHTPLVADILAIADRMCVGDTLAAADAFCIIDILATADRMRVAAR